MFTIVRIESVWPDGKRQNLQLEAEFEPYAVEAIKDGFDKAIRDSNKSSSGQGSIIVRVNGVVEASATNLGWSEMRANEDRVTKMFRGFRQAKKK
jgi:hypothetical protein